MKPAGHLKMKNVVSTLCKLVGPILKALLDTTVLDYCLTEAEVVSARLHCCWESYQPVTQSRAFPISLCRGWRSFSFFLLTWFWSCSHLLMHQFWSLPLSLDIFHQVPVEE